METKVDKSQCCFRILYGREMKTKSWGCNETVWIFPEGVEIKDDVKYLVWYTWKDSADSSDSSMYYTVHYIEEV